MAPSQAATVTEFRAGSEARATPSARAVVAAVAALRQGTASRALVTTDGGDSAAAALVLDHA